MNRVSVWLIRWAALGFFLLLCAPWWMPSNKLYHQLLVAFLWLPALIGLFFSGLRPQLPKADVAAYVALAFWTLGMLLVRGGDDPLSSAKVVGYVTLMLLGVILAARLGTQALQQLLWVAIGIGGLAAAVSWINFYAVVGQPITLGNPERLPTVGIWDAPILGAHALGALCVLGCGLLRRGGMPHYPGIPKHFETFLGVLAVLGYTLFLVCNQTRGVWLALLAVFVVLLCTWPPRIRWQVALVVTALGMVLFFYEPMIFLQRGVSYRPEIWASALNLMAEHFWLGRGAYDVLIPLTATFTAFHPHNLFLDIGVRLGAIGLGLFLLVWLLVVWRAWQARDQALGLAVLLLWVFSTVSLMTDGPGLWRKPNADWLVTWLPIALSWVLAQAQKQPVGDEVLPTQLQKSPHEV